jgi:hypothetical protein
VTDDALFAPEGRLAPAMTLFARTSWRGYQRISDELPADVIELD